MNQQTSRQFIICKGFGCTFFLQKRCGHTLFGLDSGSHLLSTGTGKMMYLDLILFWISTFSRSYRSGTLSSRSESVLDSPVDNSGISRQPDRFDARLGRFKRVPSDSPNTRRYLLQQDLRRWHFEFPHGERNFAVSTSTELHWAVAEVGGLV